MRMAEASSSMNVAVKINAFAGSGKTTMLRLLAQAFPEKKLLYLAFNK